MILLTSVNADEAIRRLKEEGLSSVLTKPARASLLLDTITKCLFDSQSTAVIPKTNTDRKVEALHDNDPDLSDILPVPRRKMARDIERRIIPRAEQPTARGLDVLIAEDNETNQIYIKYLMDCLLYTSPSPRDRG